MKLKHLPDPYGCTRYQGVLVRDDGTLGDLGVKYRIWRRAATRMDTSILSPEDHVLEDQGWDTYLEAIRFTNQEDRDIKNIWRAMDSRNELQRSNQIDEFFAKAVEAGATAARDGSGSDESEEEDGGDADSKSSVPTLPGGRGQKRGRWRHASCR